MESIEDIGFGGLKLIQSADGFRFGIDAVLLADFASKMCPAAGRIADLGTGNGVVPLILTHKIGGCSVTGIDIQEKAIELARRSCSLNGLEKSVDFIHCDIACLQEERHELRASFDAVVSNPPYVARGAGIASCEDSRFISRQETTAGIEEFAAAAAFLLREKGHFVLVHRPSRLADIIFFCRQNRLEPKDIQLVSPRAGGKPNIVLLHCIKGGGRELNFCDPLHVYEETGGYSAEILKIYEKTR